jgi:glutathione S-transferase
MASSNQEVILGYYPVRGLAGIVRSLLAYCDIPFTNKNYTFPDNGEWAHDKQNLGFDYPNVPYLIDGDKKVTESVSILYYIANRAGKLELVGNNVSDEKFIQVLTAFNVAKDLQTELVRLRFLKEDAEKAKEESFASGKAKSKLEILNKNLEGKEWLCGFLSIADFQLYEIVDRVYDSEPQRLEAYPNIVSFLKRFIEIPQIKAHRASDKFYKA